METVAEPLRLLEIEKELAGPDRDAAFSRYDAALAALAARADAALKEGCPPEEFRKVGEIREATILARKILRLTVRADG